MAYPYLLLVELEGSRGLSFLLALPIFGNIRVGDIYDKILQKILVTYIKTLLEPKLFPTKFPTKELVMAYLLLCLGWSLKASKISLFFQVFLILENKRINISGKRCKKYRLYLKNYFCWSFNHRSTWKILLFSRNLSFKFFIIFDLVYPLLDTDELDFFSTYWFINMHDLVSERCESTYW